MLLVSTEIAEGWLENWGSALGREGQKDNPDAMVAVQATNTRQTREGELSQTRAVLRKGKVALK